MQCPHCHGEVWPRHLSRRCRHCGAKVYFYDKWRWLRGIGCGLIDLLIMYRWYPMNHSGHLRWLLLVQAIFLALLILSFRLIPAELALTPQDGPIRLDL
jgi:hypothetical protein